MLDGRRSRSSRCRCTSRDTARRGFNQAARAGAARSASRSRTSLRRRRRRASQTDLPAAQRHANVRDAFARPARCGRSHGLRARARGRCEHDGRDAGGVRAVLMDGGAREVRALTAARVVIATALSTSALTSSLARSPSSRSQLGVCVPDAGSSRARATAARDRARTDRGPRPCAAPRSPARCRAGSSGPAAAGTAGCRPATRDRAPAPRRKRCSTPVSDRRRRSSAASTSRLDSRLVLVAVGDVEQLHDVGGVLALAVQRRGDLGADGRRVVGKRQQPARRGRVRSRQISRSRSAWVCLPL